MKSVSCRRSDRGPEPLPESGSLGLVEPGDTSCARGEGELDQRGYDEWVAGHERPPVGDVKQKRARRRKQVTGIDKDGDSAEKRARRGPDLIIEGR